MTPRLFALKHRVYPVFMLCVCQSTQHTRYLEDSTTGVSSITPNEKPLSYQTTFGAKTCGDKYAYNGQYS